MKSFDYNTYLSPFTWRYGSDEMRTVWSEVYKRKLWRKIWVELARAQHKQGLVTKEELEDLVKHQGQIDIEKSHKTEKEIRHDLMAEIKTYAQQAKKGGGKLHLGATSMDIEDNADTVRTKESLALIEKKLDEILAEFKKKIIQYKDTPCMGYTHLQPAEPTTLGYRFAFYAQDLLLDRKLLHFVQSVIKGKGMKGAVGTAASYAQLMDKTEVMAMEKKIMNELGIEAFDVASQTSPRKIEYFIAIVLSSIAQSLHKFAFDLRIMQSPGFGEWQEPFGKTQVGSSAMPFKKNPINAEQICSLARLVFHLSSISGDNASHMLLERTLDDSANRRIYLPEMFLAVDEMLKSAEKVVEGLIVHDEKIKKNLEAYGPFSAIEAILMKSVKKGANRQEMHEIFRELSLKTWEDIQKTQENSLTKRMINDKRIIQFLSVHEIEQLLDPKEHIGLARDYCEKLLKEIL